MTFALTLPRCLIEGEVKPDPDCRSLRVSSPGGRPVSKRSIGKTYGWGC